MEWLEMLERIKIEQETKKNETLVNGVCNEPCL